MHRIERFTIPPSVSSSKFNWHLFADGSIWSADRGKDFESMLGFKQSMSKWAKQNGFTVKYRSVGDDQVEFQFIREA